MADHEREPLEKLKTYPAFQVLRAKAETHQLQFRPKESAKLQRQGLLEQVLDERTESCWNALADARRWGYDLDQAQEFAYPIILLRGENEPREEPESQIDQ